MNIGKYIEEYKFENYLEKLKEEFKEKTNIQVYLENNSEESFKKFSQEFWENPNVSVSQLKGKYNLPQQIGFSDIIKAYPTEQYIKFLKKYYNNFSIDDLVSQFAIPYDKLKKIIVPIIIDGLESFCPKCLNDSFEYVSGLDEEVILECKQCYKQLQEKDLLTREQVEQEIEKNKIKKLEFDEKMLRYEEVLKDIKCPKCQEELYLNKHIDYYTYKIKCKKCGYSSSNIEETIKQFEAWKKRAAMMIAIKAKEQELIEKALESKKEKDIVFTKEDIITNNENDSTIDFFEQILNMDNIQLWSELFKRIRSCNRLEKKVLIAVIELLKNEGEKAAFFFGEVYVYNPSEPIIYDLINITKVIVMRQVIRRLMKQSFIVATEELNYILIPKILVDNLEAIKNLMVVKDIGPNVRYIVFERQNFTCMMCGETGRPLKIAYMTADKNINDLSGLVALCDNCYDIATRNEILIDGTITFEVDYLDNSSLKSFDFLMYYHPELKNDENVRSTLEGWENDFSLSDIVKAITITIDKIKKQKIDGTVNTLLSYTSGILKKSVEGGTPVNLYGNLKEQYNLKKWIGDM